MRPSLENYRRQVEFLCALGQLICRDCAVRQLLLDRHLLHFAPSYCAGLAVFLQS